MYARIMSYLRDAEGVTESHADLGRGQTLLGQLADVLGNLRRGHLQPGRGTTAVRQRGAGHTLTRTIHATHLEKCD